MARVHYVTAEGAVWKLSAKKFDAFRVALTEGKAPWLNDYGKMIINQLTLLSDLEAEAERPHGDE